MNRIRMHLAASLETLKASLPSFVGLASLGLIVLGVWGLYGWEVAAITAGLPPASFYLYGQALAARGPGGPE